MNTCTPLCAAASLLVAAGAHAQVSYQVVELAPPAGAAAVTARAINAAGHAAGYMKDSAGNLHPVVWVDGAPTILPLAPGFPGATATGISDSGVVCGSAWSQGSFGFSAAVKWTAGVPAFIPTLGGQYSAADGINAADVVTGWTSSSEQFNGQRAYRFDGALESAGLIPGGGSSWTVGSAINASGQIVGAGMTASNARHAFLDDPAEGMMDLGTLGGVASEAIAVSGAGHVAGWSQTGVRDATTYDGVIVHAFRWHRGRMTDLGVVPGTLESRATGVNSAGTVVGSCTNPPTGSPGRAFVWSGGVMTDLNAAIPAGTGWTLQSAHAVNDAGRIVGAGLLAGQPRAFLLIPNP